MSMIRAIVFTTINTLLGLAINSCLPSIGLASSDAQAKNIIGWIEKVEILPERFQLSAKVDTGADNSSINVHDPSHFTKGEEKWIRFSIPLEKDRIVTLERPIHRFTRIKQKQGASIKRVVVLFDLCIGTIFKKDVQVNLANRGKFKYPMLIGRSFLKGSAIVDSALTFTRQPSCSELKRNE